MSKIIQSTQQYALLLLIPFRIVVCLADELYTVTVHSDSILLQNMN